MNKLLKRLAIVIGVLVFLVLAAVIIVPLVVDVDKYRPQIVQVANEKLNGKLELGKLSLSLWGQIRVEVAGVKLTDARGAQVVAVKDAFFHVPFSSLFGGAPLLTFKMQQPEIVVIKDKAGKLNVMSLMKTTEPTNQVTPPTGSKTTTTGSNQGGDSSPPSMVSNARLGVEIRDAQVTYKDESTGVTSINRNMNLLMKDISLSRATDFELWGDLDTKMGKSLNVVGPMKLTATAKPKFTGGKFESANLEFKGNFDELMISMPGLFEKKKGIAAHFEGAMEASQEQAKIEHFEIKFHNADVKIAGTVTDLAPKAGAVANPVVHMTIKSNEISLKPWNELIPMLKEYDLGGSMKLDAQADGPSDKLAYRADLVVKALTAKAPHLKAQPQFDAVINVITDQLKSLSVTMKAPGNDLRINGSMISFTHPKADLQVASSGMDLDQLIDFPPPAAATTKVKTEAPAEGKTAEGAPSGENPKTAANPNALKADFDALLDPLRTNPMMASMSAKVGVSIKMLKAKGVKINDLNAHMSFIDLVGALDQFSMGVFGGTIRSSMSAQLKPKAPTYHFTAEVAGLDLQQAVESQLALMKNTLVGKAFFKMDGSGASFNPDPAKVNLNAKGNFRVEKAKFATVDVGKMASEGINKAIERVAEKVPPLKGKTIGAPSGKETVYDSISSDFTIAGGKFSAPNFTAKAAPNQGIDLSGSTTVGMVDNSLKAAWQVVDTYNFTHAKDLSVEQAGVRVEHILAEGNSPVKFPVSAGCTITQPCYSYTEVPESLGKVAFANVSQAVQGKAKSEVQKRVMDKVQEAAKNAPAPVQNAIQGLGKKLFGH